MAFDGDSGVSTTALRRRQRPVCGRAAFTLIELLLVVAIGLIAAGIAVPLFSRAFQGSQLRAAARQLVMTAKYARSMAILRQHYMAILFDKGKSTVEVVAIEDRRALAFRDRFLSDRGEAGVAGSSAGDEAVAAGSGAQQRPAIRVELAKALPQDIRIARFSTRASGRTIEDVHFVNVFPNGMSEGFEIELVDKSGKRARVRVDGLSGNAKVEFL